MNSSSYLSKLTVLSIKKTASQWQCNKHDPTNSKDSDASRRQGQLHNPLNKPFRLSNLHPTRSTQHAEFTRDTDELKPRFWGPGSENRRTSENTSLFTSSSAILAHKGVLLHEGCRRSLACHLQGHLRRLHHFVPSAAQVCPCRRARRRTLTFTQLPFQQLRGCHRYRRSTWCGRTRCRWDLVPDHLQGLLNCVALCHGVILHDRCR